MRRLHFIVWHNNDAYIALTGFDGAHRGTFFVQQIRGDRHWHDGMNFFGVFFQRFFFNQTQNRERQRLVVTHGTGTGAARADVMAGLAQRWAQALTGHLQQTKTGDMADLNARAVLANGFTQTVFHRTLMANRRHIDEVDNDQAAEVAQTQLAGNLISRFKVGIKRRLFDIAAAGGAGGVDIDRGQRFGAVDNDRPAGRQAHFTLEGGLNLRFNLIMAEQRDFTGVQFDFAAEIRTTQRGDMLAGQLEHFRVIDQDFADVLAQIVAESTNNDVTFLVDQERRRTALCRFLNRFPVLQAEAQVPLQGFGGFADACGAHDKAHAVRQLKARQRFFQFGAIVTLNTTGNSPGARVVRHQDQIAACQADKGSERRAFVAAFFFINLHDNFLTFTQDVFNIRTAMRIVIGGEVFAGDFFEGEETMTLGAVIDKRGFKAGFNAGDLAFVDVRFFLFVPGAFDIQVVQALPINKGDAQLFLLSCVD
ncbi:Uncharacterised protein [Klebsiella quasivariicola]|nr:Uncharacterised protein [Klebsiella quasivariicola]